ncbi:MAG: PRC-barrel domain-containing protein [Brachybacterium sp.]|nr:PRC-barrel domain-containing protein [Brachybacterium sp.]
MHDQRAGSTAADGADDVEPRRLAGLPVLGSDGHRVGWVRDIYCTDADGQLAAIAVATGRLSPTMVLIPADLIGAVTAQEVRAEARSEVLREGMEAPATGHLRPSDLDRARRALTTGTTGAAPRDAAAREA